MTRIVLASTSSRRHDLLTQLGVTFAVAAPDIDESVVDGEAPRAYVRRLAAEKASAVAGVGDALVIAADTTVELDGRILGKPADAVEAREMLRALSARTHRVHTGVAVCSGTRTAVDVATTMVTMTPISDASIERYVATGEPFDKAGGYAVQGAAAVFVLRVSGSVSNVIGLPLHIVVRLSREVGVDLLALR